MRAPLSLLVLAIVALLAACNREPSFDERYTRESGKIDAAAQNMALELDGQINASTASGRTGPKPLPPRAGQH